MNRWLSLWHKFADAFHRSDRNQTPLLTRYLSGNDVSYDQIDVIVAGPGAANRLFLIYGILRGPFGGEEDAPHLLTCHIGPTLRPEQVHGIITSASLAGVSWQAELSSQRQGYNDNVGANWHIENAETHFDPVVSRLMLRVIVMSRLLSSTYNTGTFSFVGKIAFQVALRAQI